MKYYVYILILLSFFGFLNCFSNNDTNDDSNKIIQGEWNFVGKEHISNSVVWKPKMIIEDGILYITYVDTQISLKNLPICKKFQNNEWQTFPTIELTSVPSYDFDLSVSDGIPYLSFSEFITYDNQKISVIKYNGSSWEYVGTPRFSDGNAYSINIFISNDMPYVAFKDAANNGKATVMKYTGLDWEIVGQKGFSNSGINIYLSLFVKNNVPYIAYEEEVMMFDGNIWQALSGTDFNDEAKQISIFVNNNVPYIVYSDSSDSIFVKKYNNKWIAFPNPYSNTEDDGNCQGTKWAGLFVENDIPYVAFNDISGCSSLGITVKKYINGNWIILGERGFAGQDTGVNNISISVYNGIPYVTFLIGDFIRVMSFTEN